MRIWIDIDNIPHIQYILPLARWMREQKHQLYITSTDSQQIISLLNLQNENFTSIGKSGYKGKIIKTFATFFRALKLARPLKKWRPDFSISSSRSCALASLLLKIPSFIFVDYEHVETSLYKRFGSYIISPSFITKEIFIKKGFDDKKLIHFKGLKENLTFALTDYNKYPPFIKNKNKILVLVRPPSESSHYFVHKSLDLLKSLLQYISSKENVLMIYSPREPSQAEYILNFEWQNEPIILIKPIHFISLYKSVDLVIAAGGTMIREAVALGIPAYSIFKGEKGAVDISLEEEGKLKYIKNSQDFSNILLKKRKKHIIEENKGKDILKELSNDIIYKFQNINKRKS